MDKMEEKFFVHFGMRRLHSLLGLFVLGAFLVEHFFTNSFATVVVATKDVGAYNEKVEFLTSMPFLTLLEIGLLGIPFLFHIVYGLLIVWEGSVNLGRCNYGRNWAYFFQRVTSILVLAFLIFHVGSLRFYHKAEADEIGFFQFLADHYFTNNWVVAFYVVGIAATVFHLANGICTFCMTWGLTVGRGSQQLMAVAATAVGLAFLGAGYAALYAFKSGGGMFEAVAALMR